MSEDLFLAGLAERLLEHGAPPLERTAVVLPSRRSAARLRQWLGNKAGRAIWSPELFTMDRFLARTVSRKLLPETDLLARLALTQLEVLGKDAFPVDEFLQWAPMLLRDMSEVDAHLLDLETFYADLTALQGIEDWSLGLGADSPGQQRLLRYWAKAGRIHRAFEQLQTDMQAGHAGHVSRAAVAHFASGEGQVPWERVWIAGAHALTPAEQFVIAHLLKRGVARAAWDTDPALLNDPGQSAGYFLRKHLAELGPGEIPPSDLLRTRHRSVVARALPDPTSMALDAGRELAALSPTEREGTTVVLADPGLLLPFLRHLPATLGQVNITMSVPLRHLPINGLVKSFHRVAVDLSEGGSTRKEDLERFLTHPFVERIPGASGLLESVRSSAGPSCSVERITEWSEGDPSSREPAWTDLLVVKSTRELGDRTLSLLERCRSAAPEGSLDLEQLYHLAISVNRTAEALGTLGEHLAPEAWTRSFDRLFRDTGLGLYGEPEAGIQVMGLLETRLLDLDRVIVVGANEGVLPTPAGQDSLIPFDVRRAYGLPLGWHHDVVIAHHFFQVVRHARHLTLLHVTGEAGSEGPSRFLLQLREELANDPDAHTTFLEEHAQAPVPVKNPPVIQVRKTERVLERLAAMFERGMSPTRLSDHLTCPLDFYFKHVRGWRDEPDDEQGLSALVLGNAVHHALEQVFRPLEGRELDPSYLLAAKPGIRERLLAELEQELPINALHQGMPLLQLEMATSALQAYLDSEAAAANTGHLELIAVETEVSAYLDQQVPGLAQQAKFIGRLDRVDRRDGIVHIMDLKTGSVQQDALSLRSLDPAGMVRKPYALQLLFYAWAKFQEDPELDTLRACVIPLQKSADPSPLPLRINGQDLLRRDLLPSMSELFLQLAERMMDASVPFEHRSESEYCTHCVPS